uniref:Uncharacterized protein n=1 Tax=Heterorhabditis bacteriophora TaxID=37862 RepID=A0A1I7XH49_HETBA
MSSTVSPSPTAVSDGLTLQTRLFLIRLHGQRLSKKDKCIQIHRTSNLIALPLIITSTLLIFIAKDWAWTGGLFNN